ncbi:YwmB family TATA-box binding protein [Metabacillus herbersteinensis]|uniref:YwmB family TATA-box binding protein n=1 Tax=Metabacillus herbersteinensis TaxID=283816 RepID=A0ABV6GM91_9BACI
MRLLILVFVISIGFSSVKGMHQEADFSQLQDLQEISKSNNINIHEFKVYVKQEKVEMSLEAIKSGLKEMKKRKPSFIWTEENDGHHTTIEGNTNRHNKIKEKVRIYVTPHQKGYKVTYTYEVIGNEIDLALETELEGVPFEYEQNNQYITVKGKSLNEAKLDDLREKLLIDFDAEKVEGLNEVGFNSISVLSEKWDTKLKLDESKSMNLQIGLRESGTQGIDVTIGTPIIITEY